jgi:SAM-dependent methyltransferase
MGSLPGAKIAGRAEKLNAPVACKICGYELGVSGSNAFGAVRGNTTRFSNQNFTLWKCPKCLSIHSLDPVDFREIYSDYPLNRRRLDIFARGTLRNLVRRLEKAGLKSTARIVDYGCGNGILIQFLNQRGYEFVSGYDPYVEAYSTPMKGQQFDCVIANDVIEHVEDPRAMIDECKGLLKPGGLLYIGTADSEPVEMTDLEPHVMRLHQPFHRVIITQASLKELTTGADLELVAAYRRSYMDTLLPFSNYRFLDELNRALGHNLDLALDPAAAKLVARKPELLFFALFGYFFPVAFEPAVVLRRRV